MRTCTGKSLSDRNKWAIVECMEAGWTASATARHVGCTRHTVYNWWQRYRQTNNVHDRAKTGRKRLFSQVAEERSFELLSDGDGNTADEVSKRLCTEGLVPNTVHKSCVIRAARRAAARAELKLWCQRGKPAKAMTAATKKKRLAFAVANQHTTWNNVCFTDRSKFHFSYPGSKVVPCRWIAGRASNSKAAVSQPNHPQCLNIYAGITKHGVTATHVVAGSSKYSSQHTNQKGQPARGITTSEYREVLSKTLLPGGHSLFTAHGTSEWTLQQDGDPAHGCAAEQIKQWNKKTGCSVQLLPNWPPNSPDLNPIENVWGWVGQEVNRMGCSSFDEFSKAVRDKLAALPKQHLTNLYASMKGRMDAVVAAGGGSTKY